MLSFGLAFNRYSWERSPACNHENQITLLWQAIEKLQCQLDADCVPDDAQRDETAVAKGVADVLGK